MHTFTSYLFLQFTPEKESELLHSLMKMREDEIGLSTLHELANEMHLYIELSY